MKRILRFNQGIIDGIYVDFVIQLYPHLVTNFTQRKSYYEYTYSEGSIELTIDDLDKLTEEFVRVIVTSGDVMLEML